MLRCLPTGDTLTSAPLAVPHTSLPSPSPFDSVGSPSPCKGTLLFVADVTVYRLSTKEPLIEHATLL